MCSRLVHYMVVATRFLQLCHFLHGGIKVGHKLIHNLSYRLDFLDGRCNLTYFEFSRVEIAVKDASLGSFCAQYLSQLVGIGTSVFGCMTNKPFAASSMSFVLTSIATDTTSPYLQLQFL